MGGGEAEGNIAFAELQGWELGEICAMKVG